MKRSPPLWCEACERFRKSAVTDALNLEQQQGIPIGRAIKLTAAKYNGRKLGDGRRLRLSRKTLERLYYAWEAAGRDPKVLELHYKPGLPSKRIDPLLLRAVVNYCVTHAVSVAGALRNLGVLRDSSASLHTFYRSLPGAKIREYLRAHSRCVKEQARVEAQNARKLARLKAPILGAV